MVIPVRIGARFMSLLGNVHLAPDYRMYPRGLCRAIKLDRPEQIPVIGDRDRGHLLLDRQFHQLVDIASPVEQRIVRMTMQVYEGHGPSSNRRGRDPFNCKANPCREMLPSRRKRRRAKRSPPLLRQLGPCCEEAAVQSQFGVKTRSTQ